MPKRICISAYNIHQGGGKVVLLAFLKEKSSEGNLLTCYIDERLEIDFEKFKNVNFIKIRPSLSHRILTEYHYKQSIYFDVFYFLGNLPPLFKLNCHVVLFLQNRLIISRPYLNRLSIKAIMRSMMEVTWFNIFIKNVDLVEVQTMSMKKVMQARFSAKKVEIHNYLDLDELYMARKSFEELGLVKEKKSFVYITSLDTHKNIYRLICAFAKLKDNNNYSLYINIDDKNKYYALSKKLNVNLKCIKSTKREDILKQIYCSEYMIFPSLIESLGLPLIEAKIMGTKIIASNLDFVFDVCDPQDVFDPYSIKSITECIKRT